MLTRYSCLGASSAVGADEIADKRAPRRKERSVDELVPEFIQAATLRGTALENGDRKVANAQLARLDRIQRTLNAQDEGGRQAMLHLLHHNVRWVQFGAATFTLDIAPHDTLSVLRELSASEKIVGLTAKLLLDWSEKQRRQPEAKAD